MKFKYFKIISLALLFSFFISSDTFAVSDIVFTYDSNITYPVTLCSGDSCYPYRYISSSCSSLPGYSGYFTLTIGTYSSNLGSFSTNYRMSPYFDNLWSISSSMILSSFTVYNKFSIDPSDGCTITLSDHLPSSSSGTLSITENGTYDVSSYTEAVVDVPDTVIYGDYHDDLVNIYHAILVCAGVCLVLYFFYCIYRMIIKSSGGH